MVKNKKFSITESYSDTQLENAFNQAIQDVNPRLTQKLKVIFKVAKENRSLFPGISLGSGANLLDYMKRWVHNYVQATENVPSNRAATPKGSCSDPALRFLVQGIKGATYDEAVQMESHHNLYMSAENVQGNLLEEYINENAEPLGWIWCAGNALQAIDFCNYNGTVLLQIKNKYNSENSSSSKIRDLVGVDIEKWHRLGQKTENRVLCPVYRWDILNQIIVDGSDKENAICSMDEDKYNQFLRSVTDRNRKLLSDK